MALTLADFDPVDYRSSFDVSASQYRSLNRHRIILEVTGDGRAFTDRELRTIKQELGRQGEIRIGSTSAFGMILKGSDFAEGFTLDAVLEIARTAIGADTYGYRANFLEVVERAKTLP